jgi:DNA-directed RNA polymerase subunit RPC12/RpoP
VSSTIGDDVVCAVCGQNLRSLTADQCPQCGLRVAISSYVSNLKRYKRSWLVRVRLGIRLSLVGFFFALLRPIFSLAESLRLDELRSVHRFLLRHGVAQELLLIAAAWLGVWFITAPPRDEIPGAEIPKGSADDRSVAEILRFLISFPCIWSIIEIVHPGQTSIVGSLIVMIMGVFLLLVDFLFFLFIQRDLAIRTGQSNLARQAALLKWVNPSARMLVAGAPVFKLILIRFSLMEGARVPILRIVDWTLEVAGALVALWIIALLSKLLKPFSLALLGSSSGRAS